MLKRLFEQNDVATRKSASAQFLTFKLGEDEYAINIKNVQELRGYNTVTPVANTSDDIKGVINLRGVIVPIVDLRSKLKLGSVTYDQSTAVMMLTIGERVVGVIVDSVSTLVNVGPEQIELLSNSSKTDKALLGMPINVGLVAIRKVHLLDIDALYSSIDFGPIERLVGRGSADENISPMAGKDRILASRYLWAKRVGDRAQVSALKFRPHWRPVPK